MSKSHCFIKGTRDFYFKMMYDNNKNIKFVTRWIATLQWNRFVEHGIGQSWRTRSTSGDTREINTRRTKNMSDGGSKMNHIYKVVWSKVKNCYVVVSEIARNGGKEHSRHAKKMPGGVYILPLALALNFGLPSSSQAAQAAEDTTIDLGNDGSTSYDGKGDLVIGNEETVATSDATKADKDSAGNLVYNYKKEDNTDELYSVTLYQAASNSIAAGTEDTDAVNVAQLKAALRQTGTGTIHDYSVNSTNTTTDTNYNYDADTGSNALAAGVSAKATGVRSVAVGNGAKAQGVDSIAIGTNAVATGQGAMVIGQYNTAEGQNSLAFGGGYNDANKGNKASSTASVAFGEGSWAVSEGSVAFGYGTQAGNTITDKNGKYTGQNAVAFGNGTKALGGRSLAFGENTTANYNDSVAFGNGAAAFSSGATAFGNRSRALSQYATSFGDNSVSAGSMSFAFGTDNIAGAALDDNGALELTDGSRMDSYGNKAYTTTSAEGKTTTYSIKGMGIPSGGDIHDYVVVTGTKADCTTGTYVEDYQGGIAEVKVNADGTVTKVKDLYSGKYGGWYQYDENEKLVRNAKGIPVVTASADMKSIPVTLDKATPGSNGYTLNGFKNATAFGYSTEASGNNATAFGNDTKAKAAAATAFGKTTTASGDNATAFGLSTTASGKQTTAFGSSTTASGDNATAFGENSTASGEAATAFGIDSTASGNNSLAGLGGTASNENSIALGKDTKADNADSAVSVAIGQNAEASGAQSLAIGFGNVSETNQSGNTPYPVSATQAAAKGAIAIGINTGAKGEHSIAMGSHTDAAKDSSVAIGFDTHAVEDSSVAIGSGTKAAGRYSVALGLSSIAGTETNDEKNPLDGGGSVAIGYAASAEASRSIAIGTGATAADSQFTTAVGDSTTAQAEGSVAIGAGSIATRGAGNKESIVSTDINTGKTTITYGDEKKAYLKPDTLSTDKISTWESTTGAVSVGGQATYKEYDDNGNLVKKTKLLTRQITNVAAGSDDTDAVNVAQLKAAQPTVTSNDHSVTIATSTDLTDYHKNYDLKIATATLSPETNGSGNSAVATGKVTVTNPTYTGSDRKPVTNENAYVTGNSVADAINNSGFKLTASSSEGAVTGNKETLIHPGDTVTIDAGKNISLTQDKGKISIATKDNLNLGSADSKDDKQQDVPGTNGSITVNGKNGSSVAINGQDGSIGLTGPKGTDGTSTSIQMSTIMSDPTLDDSKNTKTTSGEGEQQTTTTQAPRIQYKNGNTTYEVATMDDGQKYAGDVQAIDAKANAFSRKLNEQTNIVGGVTKLDALSTGNNVGVVSNGTDTLTIRLAKELTDLTSVTTVTKDAKGNKTSETVQNGKGITIIPSTLGAGKTTVSLTDNGLSNGGNQITHVDSGLKDAAGHEVELKNATGDVLNNAVNVGDLKNVQNAVTSAHTAVTVNGSVEAPAVAADGKLGNYTDKEKGNLLLAQKKDTTTGKITYDLKLNDNVILGKDTSDGKDGQEGTIGLTGKDGLPGTDGKQGYSTTIIKTEKGQAGADGKTGKESLAGTDMTRIVYTDKDGGNPQTVATLDDGLKFVGNDGKEVTKKLNSTLSLTGGITDTDALQKASGKNLGVRSNKDGDGLEIVMTDTPDFTKVTVGGEVGKKITIGEQPNTDTKNPANGNYITGLDNTKWDKDHVTENRAATEGQLRDIAGAITNQTQGGGFALTSDEKGDDKIVKQDLGKAIQIKGDTTYKADGTVEKAGNIKTSVDVDNKAIKVELNKDVDLTKDGSIKAGETTINKDGVNTNEIKVGDITITNQGINGGAKQITNMASGIDGKQYGDAGDNNAASIGDVKQLARNEAKASEAKSGKNITVKDDHTVNLNDDIILGNDPIKQVTVKGSEGQVTIGSGDKTLTLGQQANGAGDKNPATGNFLNGLDNRNWDGEHIQNGRAATEDQLKTVSDAVKSAAATAGKHTVVTVEGGKDAGTTDYNGENLKLKVTDTAGQKTYDLKLSDKLNLGAVGKDGEKGTDGSIGLKGADGKSSIGLNGKDGISVIGKDGKNGVSIIGSNGLNGKDGIDGKISIGTPGKDGQPGKDAVSISGQNGEGHIGLTGPKGEPGADGTPGKDGISIDITTDLKSATLDDGKNVKTVIKDKEGKETTIEQAPRIQYKSGDSTYEVATMDDGQKYAGDFGDGASVKLNKTVTIKGNVAAGKTKDDFVDGNIAVVANKNGEDGELLLKLNKDLTGLNSSSYATTTRVDGKDVTSKTVVDGTGLKIDNGPSITNTGIDGGKHQITNVASGKDGKMYDTTVEGQENWNNAANIGDVTNIAKSAADGVQAKSGKNITVDDNNKVNLNDHITLGDAANKAKQVDIDGNGAKITAGDGNNKVTVDGSKGQIIAGGDNGVKIGNIAGGDRSLTIYDKDGNATNQTDKAGKYVTNLGNKTWNKDGSYVSGRAATEDQLHQVESNVNKQIADVNTKIDEVDKHHTEVTVNGGTAAKADGSYTDGNLQLKQTTGEDGQKVYDLKLNDQLKVGQKGDAGKAGKDGNVTVETKGGTTVVIGHDGKDGKDGRDGLFVTGKDGKNGKSGVSITGPNGVAGRDGVDGKVGIAGKDGRDAVSIAGRDGVGHIGLTGPKGADGKDGAFTDLSTILGQATLDYAKNVKGKDGDAKDEKASRIHYETTAATKDGEKIVSHEVATMDDGMKYSGDSGSVAVKLNNNVQLYGGAKEYAAGDNIGVVVSQDGDNAKMQVKLAKDLKGIDSIDAKTVTTGNTTINNGGLTVKGDDKHKDITVQQGAVNMGGNKVENVAPGRIAPDSTDAVNGSQLAQRDQAIGKLGGEVSSLDRRVDRVGAGAAALAALHPQNFDPDDKWDFAVGYGNYRGANAAAVGAFYRPNEDTTLSVGGTVGGGENMVNTGISFKFGQGNHVTNSRVAMAKEILALKDYVQKQDEKIEKLEALVGQQGTANAPKRRSILFPDVPENHWAYVYVKKLADRGLLEGYPDGEFKGTRTITRYEFAAIFSRALENGASVDGDMERMSEEFEPEIRELSLTRFRVDRVEGDDNDRHKIERVRVNDRDELVKQKNGEQKKRYRDVYGSVIEKDAPSDAVK